MMKTKLLILPLLLGLSIFASGCTNTTQDNNTGDIDNTTGKTVGMANPASVYCEENSGTLELIFDNGESYGMCYFPNGSVCEEREFFHKECFPLSENEEQEQAQKEKQKTEEEDNNTTTGDQTNNTKKETITDILENHANTKAHQEDGLTEDDIDFIEAIIEKLK